MYVKVLAVIGLVAVASATDLSVGVDGGRLIFEQNITASPAIWRQTKNLTVNATNSDEVISRVVVIDNRPEKDGEAKVVEGGEGQKNVTLELQSPAVFRGFDFSIQVFAAQGNENTQAPIHPKTTGIDTQNPQVPFKDLNVDHDASQEPKNGDDIILGAPTPTATSTTEANKDDQDKINNPTLVGEEQTRLNRDTKDQKTKDQTSIPTPVNDHNVNHDANQEPKNGDDIVFGAPTPTAASTTEANKDDQDKINTPALVGKEQTRLNRDTVDQKTKDQTLIPTPVNVDATKDIKVNDNANKTVAELDDDLKKAVDSIFSENSTQKTEDFPKDEAHPVMPQPEGDDLINLRDDEENRKVRQANKEPTVPVSPKEGDEDHTILKSELSSTTEKNIGQDKFVPRVVPVTSDSSSTTAADKVTTESSKLTTNVKTTQELERNIKGHHGHQGHFGHHHAVPLPYVN